jgi:dTDP-4-amino-4,6-dideoxygalactose transaminase
VSYRIFLSEPTVGDPEAEAASATIRARKLTAGPALGEFEARLADFIGVPEVIAVSTGTAGLHLALLDVGVTPGDEVWVSDLTFIATANAASYCDARLVLIDSERETWNLDPDVVVDELNERARAGTAQPAAIVPVHLLGHPARLAPILEAAERYGVPVIEDAAEALGTTWTEGPHAGAAPGTVGTGGVFSFNGNKLMTTGGGGALVATDPARRARLRHVAEQGKIPGSDYEHDIIGYNYRLSHVSAAIGNAQLDRLPGMIERRRTIADRYAAAFADLPTVGSQPDAAWAERSGWLASIVLPDIATRTTVRVALDAEGIEARPMWRPVRQQAPYVGSTVLGGDVAVELGERVLCLPCSAHLTDDQQDEVIGITRDALAQVE